MANWPQMFAVFCAWLDEVKRQSDAPDLWALARQERRLLTSTADDIDQNAPFTRTERELLARHLATIQEYTKKSFNLQAEHAAHVEAQLKYLAEAAERVGRFDYKNLVVSTLLNIVVTLGLDLDKAQKLYGLATQLLGPIVMGFDRFLGV